MDCWAYISDPILERTLCGLDAGVASHCERVARHAVQLGALLGFDGHDLGVLGLAGRIHDIGKLHVPAAIVQKSGRLTPHEWALMQRHSETGQRIVLAQRDIPFREEVALLVRHHHEHWDGGGYPDGLRGDAIPISARILVVVDSYDALTSERPYHRPRTHAEAMAILLPERCTKHDPDLLDLFVQRVIGAVD